MKVWLQDTSSMQPKQNTYRQCLLHVSILSRAFSGLGIQTEYVSSAAWFVCLRRLVREISRLDHDKPDHKYNFIFDRLCQILQFLSCTIQLKKGFQQGPYT